MPPKLKVSQEAFDSAVQENIDEFDMEPEEALRARAFSAAYLTPVLGRGARYLCTAWKLAPHAHCVARGCNASLALLGKVAKHFTQEV